MSQSVRTIDLDDTLVLVDSKSGQYFALNAVGKTIWELLEEGTPFPAMVKRIAAEYRADEGVVAGDTRRIVGELIESGLVTKGPRFAQEN